MLTPREKSPLPENVPRGVSNPRHFGSEPKHYQLSYSGPGIHNECLGNTTPVYTELSERGDPWYSQIASHVTSAQLSIASHWIVHPNQITCSLNREFRHHRFPLLHWRQIPQEQLRKAMVTHALVIRPDVGNPPSPPTTKSFGDSCQPICYRMFSHSSKDNSHHSRADHPVP